MIYDGAWPRLHRGFKRSPRSRLPICSRAPLNIGERTSSGFPPSGLRKAILAPGWVRAPRRHSMADRWKISHPCCLRSPVGGEGRARSTRSGRGVGGTFLHKALAAAHPGHSGPPALRRRQRGAPQPLRHGTSMTKTCGCSTGGWKHPGRRVRHGAFDHCRRGRR